MASDIVEELLDRVDIVDVIQRYVPLKRAGSNFSGCCPFHNEKTPSFIVSPTKQIFKCFGCGVGGNVFKFIQEIEKCDFRDAVKILAERENLKLEDYQNSFKYHNQNDEIKKEMLKRIHKLAQEYFVEQLQHNPQALQYVKEERKLTDEVISEFGIGYAPDHFSELLNVLKSKGFSDEDLIESSLAKKNEKGDIFCFFRKRITFPIYDLMNNIVGFTARVLNHDELPKYLNSAEHRAFEKGKILYGLAHSKPHIVKEKKVIIVEGQMDVIGLSRLWFPLGVATSGTALTEMHIKTLKRFTEKVYLLFDNDSAGLQATFRALKLCYHQNIYPKMLTLPQGVKDVDELANQQEGKEIFTKMLEDASDGFLVIFERVRAGKDMSSSSDKQDLINGMFELILSIENLTMQEHYKEVLADKLWFPVVTITHQFTNYKNKQGKFFIRQKQNQEEKKTSYSIDREQLFDVLFFEEFIKNLIDNEEFIQNFLKFWKIIAEAVPESLLSRAINHQLTEWEKEQIRELQLWWENELLKYSETEIKIAIIKKIMRGAWNGAGNSTKFQEYSQQAMKSKMITDAQKKELSQLKINLMK